MNIIIQNYLKLVASGSIKHLVGWFALSVCLLALMINIPVLIITLKKISKNIDIKLIILVTISDILLSTLVIVFQIIRASTNFSIYIDSISYCQFEGLLLTGLVHTSLYSVSILSLERYFLIVKKQEIKESRWWIMIFISSIITWIVSLNLFINNEFILMPSAGYCLISYNSSLLSKFAVSVFTVEGLIACSILVFSYINIMLCRMKQINTLKNISKKNEFNPTVTKKFKTKLMLIRILGVIFIYLLCMFPSIMAFFYELIYQKERPIMLDAIAVCLISCTNLGNAILVLVLHKETRNTLVNLFKFK